MKKKFSQLSMKTPYISGFRLKPVPAEDLILLNRDTDASLAFEKNKSKVVNTTSPKLKLRQKKLFP